MTSYQVINRSNHDRHIRTVGGGQWLKPGKEYDLDLPDVVAQGVVKNKWARVGVFISDPQRPAAGSPGGQVEPSNDPTAAFSPPREEPIPDGWEEMSFQDKRSLASKFTDDVVRSNDQADEVIKREIERRG